VGDSDGNENWDQYINEPAPPYAYPLGNRHNGMANVLFAGGNVRPVYLKQVSTYPWGWWYWNRNRFATDF